MNPIGITCVVLVALALVVVVGRRLDARVSKRGRRDDDVAGRYLAEAGIDGVPHAIPLPLWITALVVIAAGAGAVAAGIGLATAYDSNRRDRSDELQACRSALSTQLVAAPQAIALKELAIHGFESTEFRTAARKLRPEQFERLTKVALEDPGRFISECHRLSG